MISDSFLLIIYLLGKCPYDFAWADKAHDENSAHYSAECSNSGICDRSLVLD